MVSRLRGIAMNKFLWRLFGIEEDEIPDPSRRGFLKMIGGAAIVGAARPMYFLSPVGGWKPAIVEPVFQFGFEGYKDLSAVAHDFIIPNIVDNIYKTSPVLTRLMDGKVAKFQGSRNVIRF